MTRTGYVIRQARLSAGLTQADLARQLQVSRVSVTKWESGQTIPSPERVRKLANALALDPSGLTDALAGAKRAQAKALPKSDHIRHRGDSLQELMSPTWRREQLPIFSATTTKADPWNLKISNQPAFYIPRQQLAAGEISSGIVFPEILSDNAWPENGQVLFLQSQRTPLPGARVLLLGKMRDQLRPACFGTFVELAGAAMKIRALGQSVESDVPLAEIDATFQVLERLAA